MSGLADEYLEQQQSYYKCEEDEEITDEGVCEICNSRYSYYYYKDNTPGCRYREEEFSPCKCGKHYNRGKNKLEGLKVRELKEILKHNKIKGYSKLNKSQLISLVKSLM